MIVKVTPKMEKLIPFQASLIKRLEFWIGKMGLDKWNFTVSFMDTPHEKCDENIVAQIQADCMYHFANVRLFPVLMNLKEDTGDDEIDEALIHELTHAVLSNGVNMFYKLHEGRHITQDAFKDNHETETVLVSRMIHDAFMSTACEPPALVPVHQKPKKAKKAKKAKKVTKSKALAKKKK